LILIIILRFMFWHEKIDLIKKRYAPPTFKIPFTEWREIFKKIEDNFIVEYDPNDFTPNWERKHIKQSNLLHEIKHNNLDTYLRQLPDTTNYWIVFSFSHNNAKGKYHVYDCQLEPFLALVHWCGFNFYVIEKKYAWFTYFDRNQEDGKVHIYKSGLAKTPFDSL